MLGKEEKRPTLGVPGGLSDKEIRLRLVEAASRAPIVHNGGPAAGVVAVAEVWYAWVKGNS